MSKNTIIFREDRRSTLSEALTTFSRVQDVACRERNNLQITTELEDYKWHVY
jgi:hypothetical protein